MFEVIISHINTGRVWRNLFETRTQADRHVERFLYGGARKPRYYRVEVHHRPRPEAPVIVEKPTVTAA